MIRYLTFGILFIHTFQCTSSDFFFVISGFLAESLKANKLAKKKDPFYNTVTIHFSFYEPQLTKH